MIKIFIDNENRTSQLLNWTLHFDEEKQSVQLTCHFRSGKKFTHPYSECKVEPTIIYNNPLLLKKGESNVQPISRAELVGNKYALIYYSNQNKCYVMKKSDIEILPTTNLKEQNIFKYFEKIANERIENKIGDKLKIAENIVRQLKKTAPLPDTALEAYCHGKNSNRLLATNLIYPFGVNESQMKAVEKAFSSQISVIEGPPGTGKTQTILNIIANVLIKNASVAIVSNNNNAVENVYHKLAKEKLDYVIARLGSNDNCSKFFSKQPIPPEQSRQDSLEFKIIKELSGSVKELFHHQNETARLRTEIDELRCEEKYLKTWIDSSKIQPLINIERYRFSEDELTDLMVCLQAILSQKMSVRDRLILLFRFGIFKTKQLNTPEQRQVFLFNLQLYYYEIRIKRIHFTLTKYEEELNKKNADDLQQALITQSLSYLHAHLSKNIVTTEKFTNENYKKKFVEFLKRYPVIGSSTHSIVNSLAEGTLLDYVIIDEASQQDIVPGILALGCAKNIIVVGDRKQLPHVPQSSKLQPPIAHYDCEKLSLLDSLISLYNEKLPLTLLKEHYRCHPKIIQFCNQQFYNNQLIPMTRDNGESALSLVITAKGNHERKRTNLRELESLSELEWNEEHSKGIISPYNAQVRLSGKITPPDFINATVHKFQGRECAEIIFSTVLDKKANLASLNFVDNPQLINVAVSRAQKKFTLVTGDNVFTENNQHISALIRYITYYGNSEEIHLSPVVSAFDLLYDEYDKSLEKFRARLDPKDSTFLSEQIASTIIADILKKDAFNIFMVHSQIPLRQLISSIDHHYTSREKDFMYQGASCDFVIYYRIGKQPYAVIEIDGGNHDLPQQHARDLLKNAILEKSGIPLLRLRTIDSKIEKKIVDFLAFNLKNQ